MAMYGLIDHHHTGTVLICTDSQVLLRAIDSYAGSVFEVIDLPRSWDNPSVVTTPLWHQWK